MAQLNIKKYGCWDDDVSNGIWEKWELWREWKQENTCKEKYLEAKKTRGDIYLGKYTAESRRCGNIMW